MVGYSHLFEAEFILSANRQGWSAKGSFTMTGFSACQSV